MKEPTRPTVFKMQEATSAERDQLRRELTAETALYKEVEIEKCRLQKELSAANERVKELEKAKEFWIKNNKLDRELSSNQDIQLAQLTDLIAKQNARESALKEAAETVEGLCHTAECKDSWSITRNMAFVDGKQAILSLLNKKET